MAGGSTQDPPKVDLTVFKGSTTQPLPEEDEAGQDKPGWYINVNWDDDDHDGWSGKGWKPDGTLDGKDVPTTTPTYEPDKDDTEVKLPKGDDDLWEFRVSMTAGLPGKAKLIFPDKIKVWESRTKIKADGTSAEIQSGTEFTAA